jgi:rhodanese-related sulfurtransferase
MEIAEVPHITCEELLQHIEAGDQVTVVDTRTSSEYTRAHIPGAVNICYDPSSLSLEREISLSALPLDTLLVLYCD